MSYDEAAVISPGLHARELAGCSLSSLVNTLHAQRHALLKHVPCLKNWSTAQTRLSFTQLIRQQHGAAEMQKARFLMARPQVMGVLPCCCPPKQACLMPAGLAGAARKCSTCWRAAFAAALPTDSKCRKPARPWFWKAQAAETTRQKTASTPHCCSKSTVNPIMSHSYSCACKGEDDP